MKLRLKNNSVRLRLTKSEVEEFEKTGHVEEAINIGPKPGQSFHYSVQSTSETEYIRAELENNRITVFLPQTEVNEWTRTPKVGLEGEQSVGKGKPLYILVEKDFTCLKPRAGEDDSDTFPYPLSQEMC